MPVGLNLKNIAVGIKSIQYIRKQNNLATSVAQLARAAVSKTAGWGFELPPDVLDFRTKYNLIDMKEKIINFVNDVVKEMKKVTWPTKEELKGIHHNCNSCLFNPCCIYLCNRYGCYCNF